MFLERVDFWLNLLTGWLLLLLLTAANDPLFVPIAGICGVIVQGYLEMCYDWLVLCQDGA